MKRTLLLAILPLAFASATCMAQHNYSPASGHVPDSASAVGIAVAILRGVVGEDSAGASGHLEASLTDGVWFVRTTQGRAVVVELAQRDAQVLRVRTSARGGEPTDLKPRGGFIGDAVTATRVAEWILGSVYGRDRIAAQKPLLATEADGVWTIAGQRPSGTLGGVAQIELRRDSGAVVRMTHSR